MTRFRRPVLTALIALAATPIQVNLPVSAAPTLSPPSIASSTDVRSTANANSIDLHQDKSGKVTYTIDCGGPVTDVLRLFFEKTHKSYVIDPDAKGIVSIHIANAGFDQALSRICGQAELLADDESDGYHIFCRPPGFGETMPADTANTVADMITAGKPERSADVPARIDADRPGESDRTYSMEYHDTPIRRIIGDLFNASGVNYDVQCAVNGSADLRLSGVTLNEALQDVLLDAKPSLSVVKINGVYKVFQMPAPTTLSKKKQ